MRRVSARKVVRGTSRSPVGTVVRRCRGGDSLAAVARRTKTVSSSRTPAATPAQLAGVAATGAGAPTAGGTKMLLVDLRGALLVLNEARCRTVERVFGVRRDQVNLTTVIALLLVAEQARRRAERLKPPRRASVADVAIGVGALRESVYGVAGPASRDTPLAGSLIAIAVLGGLVRPPVVRSIHGMRASSRRMHTIFLGRYGHLIGRSRRG